MTFELTKLQKKHLKSIEWLLDDKDDRPKNAGEGPSGNRQTGRTTLMAYVFVKMALKRPHRDILVFDHTGIPRVVKFLMEEIVKIAEELGVAGLTVNMRGHTIRYTPPSLED